MPDVIDALTGLLPAESLSYVAPHHPILLARLCRAAYDMPDDHPDLLKVGDLEALVQRSGRRLDLCFRGTTLCRGSHDILMDIWGYRWPWEEVGCLAHRGGVHMISRAAAELWRAVADHEGELVLSGHSLGGLLAELFGLWCVRFGRKPSEIVTFGAPRPGGSDVRQALEGVAVTHYRMARDPVPDMPPWPTWHHPGKVIRLGQPSQLPSALRALTVFLPGIAGRHHGIDSYIAALS